MVFPGLSGDNGSEVAAFEKNDKHESKGLTASMWRSQPQQLKIVQEKFVGCLLGGAVGDALGAPVEFMERYEILEQYGPDGITEYVLGYHGLGIITDDTQMTLFTAEGLIRSWVRQCFTGVTSYASVTANAYLRWLHTQKEQLHSNIELDSTEPGWLFQQRLLHNRRAPGHTCITALQKMNSLGAPANNDSKGCGGVMRVAPVGLFGWRLGHQEFPQKTFDLGTELAALTHGHLTGSLTGGVLAVLVLALTDGVSLPQALVVAKTILRKKVGHEETLRAIESAESLAESGVSYEDAISQLGQGWVAEEALAISIYCALVASTFRDGVILAINHDGDSDSTGAIAGNLLGAIYGVKAIPPEWLVPLELREVITELAEDLYAFKDWDIGEFSEDEALKKHIWSKYPGF